MSIDYKSKTTRHSRTTFLKTDEEGREEALREGTKHQNEFGKIGEEPEAAELSEIKLEHDMLEGG